MTSPGPDATRAQQRALAVLSNALSPAPPPLEHPPHKLALCVRTDLKMGKGKMCAQCGHGAVAAYTLADPDSRDAWFACGEPKIVLKLVDAEHHQRVLTAAQVAGLPCYTVLDAGRTQVEYGAATVLAIGPAESGAIDKVTVGLKLL